MKATPKSRKKINLENRWKAKKEVDSSFFILNHSVYSKKKWQATYITPLRPSTLAAFPPWGIQQELVV